jgi:hypothetical protein
MEAIINGDTVKVTELRLFKKRILNPSLGVSFTPRKKPRCLEDQWEFLDLELLQTIKEGPNAEDAEEVQDRTGKHWHHLGTTVETLKAVFLIEGGVFSLALQSELRAKVSQGDPTSLSPDIEVQWLEGVEWQRVTRLGGLKTSRMLHALVVVRMKLLEAHFSFKLLVVHVTGEWMKAQGTYGVSRGQLRIRQKILHGCAQISRKYFVFCVAC